MSSSAGVESTVPGGPWERQGAGVAARRIRGISGLISCRAIVATSSTRAIMHTPGVVGGRARLAQTRIPVWIIVGWSRDGLSVGEIAEYYPSLAHEDIETALEYAREHPDEIERDLADQDDDSD